MPSAAARYAHRIIRCLATGKNTALRRTKSPIQTATYVQRCSLSLGGGFVCQTMDSFAANAEGQVMGGPKLSQEGVSAQPETAISSFQGRTPISKSPQAMKYISAQRPNILACF